MRRRPGVIPVSVTDRTRPPGHRSPRVIASIASVLFGARLPVKRLGQRAHGVVPADQPDAEPCDLPNVGICAGREQPPQWGHRRRGSGEAQQRRGIHQGMAVLLGADKALEISHGPDAAIAQRGRRLHALAEFDLVRGLSRQGSPLRRVAVLRARASVRPSAAP